MVLEDLKSFAAVYFMSQIALETGGLCEALPFPLCETPLPKPLHACLEHMLLQLSFVMTRLFILSHHKV